MYELFSNWKKSTSQFTRLQWVYGTATVILLLLGGVISLINVRAGVNLAAFSGYAGIIFVVNFIINAILIGTFGPASTPQKTRTRK